MDTEQSIQIAQQKDHVAERLHIAAVIDYLARSKTYDSLTVSEICENSKISRTSFYRLFADKYDAANWYMFQVLDVGNSLTGRNYSWYEGNLITLSGCMLMKDLMGSAWKSQGYHAMKETGIRKKYQEMVTTITQYKNMELTDELRFQCDAFAYLESYVVRTWIRESEPRSVEEMAAYIDHLVPPMLHELLNKPIDPKPAEKLTLGSLTLLIS